MSMSTHVIGFRPPDARWQQMYQLWTLCQQTGSTLPPEVEAFFRGETPDPAGITVALPVQDYVDTRYQREGYELRVADIPSHVTIIRFYNSW